MIFGFLVRNHHIGLWDVKRKALLTANVYPPLEDQGSGLHCRGLFSRSRALAGSEGGKATLVQSDVLCSKPHHFNLFIEKCLLDNTTGIRYLNPSRLLLQYDCCLISVPATYWDASFYGTQPQIFSYFDLKKGILIIRTFRQA